MKIRNFKVTNQGRMVGIFYLRYLKMGHSNLRAVKNIIELSSRRPAGVGGLAVAVGISQTSGGKEQLKFPIAPQNIEIPGNNNRLFYVFKQDVQILQLVLPVAEFDGQVHQKNRKVFQFELNHEALDAVIKIMEFLGHNFPVGQDGIPLLVQYRQFLRH